MNEVQQLYSRRARRYDFTSKLYYLMGVPMMRYRRQAVNALQLHGGARVLELACGTGLNFPLLQQAVGPEGHIIGLDLTPAMLAKAGERVEAHGWKNVELIQGDATRFQLREPADGVLCTFGLSLMPDYVSVMAQVEKALRPGGRVAIADVRLVEGGWRILNSLTVWLMKPFGDARPLLERKPWEEMRSRFADFHFSEHYLGFIWVASGQRKEVAP